MLRTPNSALAMPVAARSPCLRAASAAWWSCVGAGCVLVLGVACSSGGGDNPVAATPTTSSVLITSQSSGTFFIGATVQFEARETLSDGTTRVPTAVTWGSDAPGVATVSATGLVTAIAAGEVTIFADVNPRGTMQFRVFPDFNGTWNGMETLASCEDSGSFEDFCTQFPPIGTTQDLGGVTFTQTEASVVGVLFDLLAVTGTVAIGGELRLDASSFPPDFIVFADCEIRNFRVRADMPAALTGTYEQFCADNRGSKGSVGIGVDLVDVTRGVPPPPHTRGHCVACSSRQLRVTLSEDANGLLAARRERI